MCRHCERLVEDIEHKEIVHRFMEISAAKISRKLIDEGLRPISADDISLKFDVHARAGNGYTILKEMND